MRILVADDDAALRLFLARALAAMGHSVETAVDGHELVRLACVSARPDLILSDINMPRCGGIAACRSLRKVLPGTRFLLMSGSPDSAADAARAGFAHVLEKPFDLERLRSAL